MVRGKDHFVDDLDKKLNDVFTGYVVRKDLVKLVKGNAAVPSYVLEFLLGQNCATDDEGQIEAGVERVVCLSTDKAAYPINAMGISKAMMEHVITANARVSAQRGGPVICCTRYGNVMCSRGSVIPLFVEQIKAGNPITITDPNMTRFLMNLDEAVDLVMFAFEHANPGDLFIQKSDASTIGDLAKAVQQLFGDTGTRVIGTRHGEKLYETLMTKEERMRSEDMGNYYRVAADNRDLNYDKYFIKGQVHTQADEDYTSHNTRRLDVEGTIKKIMTTEYIQEALKEAGKA